VSQENVEIVRAFCINLGGEGRRLEHLHPAVVRPDFPDAGVYRDHDGFRQLAARFDELLAERPLDSVEAGADAVLPLRWTTRGRLTGASFDERLETWLFTVDGGSITAVVEFATRKAALEPVARRG
jgi:ketosteroid isomerase-like protein